MLLTVIIPLVLQVTVPLGLIAWLAVGRPPTRAGWALRVILVAAYLVVIALTGYWLAFPWYTPHILAACAAVMAVRSFRRIRGTPGAYHGFWPAIRGFLLGVSVALTIGLAIYALAALRGPAAAVDLALPLRNGSYVVVNGGANLWINHHIRTLDGKRFPQTRGQSYGVDLVKLGPWGLRARGALPADPRAYAIFGEPVYAPCAGEVLATWDGLTDLSVPRVDTLHPAGNAVLLRCDSIWVLLAHMKKGSVRVHSMDQVDLNTMLGQAGNTGATGEPHLHIHAQRPGSTRFPLSGVPLEIRLGGTYPAKNRRLMYATPPAPGQSAR